MQSNKEHTQPPEVTGAERAQSRSLCFRMIKGVLGRLGWRYKLYIPATVALSAVFLLPPRFLQFFTSGAEGMADISADRFVYLLVVFGAAVAICLWLSIFFSSLLSEWLRLKVSIGLRKAVLDAMHRTRIEALDDAHRGDWMTRVTSDLYETEGFLTDSIPNQIKSLTLALGSAVLFFTYSGWVALIPIVGAVLLAWFNAVVQRKMAPILQQARELEGDVFQSLMESYEGLRTIRSTGGEEQSARRMGKSLSGLYAAGMRVIRTMAALIGLNEFAGQLVVTAALTVAAIALQGGELTAQTVLVYPFFINVFLQNAKELANSTYDWNRFFIEGGRLASVLHDESSKNHDDKEVFGDLRERVGTSELSLGARGLVIGYAREKPVIQGLDFQVNPGEVVAIMGPSGCGKSTLLESLAGLRTPQAGEFVISRGDHELGSFPVAPVFTTAFVEQRPYLFVGSYRENLLLGVDEKDTGDEQVWEALEKVELAETVRKRGGLDAVLSDRGLNMSEGQRYRLTLCRALLAKRSFLFLDEPFAALDEASITGVVHAMHAEKARGAGIIAVTHVLPEELKQDRVFNLENRSS